MLLWTKKQGVLEIVRKPRQALMKIQLKYWLLGIFGKCVAKDGAVGHKISLLKQNFPFPAGPSLSYRSSGQAATIDIIHIQVRVRML